VRADSASADPQESAVRSEEVKISFSFGENWKEFVEKRFTAERVEISKQHILRFLELPDLRGKYFIDVGSGSGLSSLAAFDAGASRLVSFDIDPASVEATRSLRALRGEPPNWDVLSGSILDDEFVAKLAQADVVYSWGVLHHTGAMWRAVENAAKLMKPEGIFYLALYTTSPKSPYWIDIKRRYNRASPMKKRLMEWSHAWRYTIFPHILARKNPLNTIRNYKTSRGMDFIADLRDWLGGYPYEDAKIEEVLEFGRKRLGLELTKIATGEACTEYLFVRRI